MAAQPFEETVPLLLALEWSPGAPPPAAALPHALAGQWLAHVAEDLAGWVPEVAALDAALMAAHFDPAEVLRPGWPVHRRLHELHQRAPGKRQGARLIAFGSDPAGDIPLPLQCEASLTGGALRVVPLLLAGAGAKAVAAQLEGILIDRGMAGAATALMAQQGFSSRVEHARFLTLHDLLAMTALQYRHMGLEPLWPLLETALLAPGRTARLDALPEPLLDYAAGEVRIALFSDSAWRQRYAAGETDPARLLRLREYFDARIRQLAAVLEAHGIAVLYVDCPSPEGLPGTA